ncbi:MAG TPA: aminodeoxychorismate synthase component I [Gemmatimonadales bacterium]|nr:aminodeoxychorismate synthase component I [Gemmatimonadales bacterium]
MISRAFPEAPAPAAAAERVLDLPGVALLESPPGFPRLGRRSFLSADPTGAPRGWSLGYLAYEYGRRFERIPAAPLDDLALPGDGMRRYDWVLEWDHDAGRATLHALTEARWAWAAARLRGGPRAPRPLGRIDAPPSTAPRHPVPVLGSGVTSTFTAAAYRAAVARVIEYIRAGDIFQANLSQRFAAPFDAHPWALYRALWERSPAPFAAYLQYDTFAVVSNSPERFLTLDAAGRVETRPIKGTRPRGRTAARDRALAEELRASAKDRAEHVMIVDLLRNDLSRVCAPGTVRAEELLVLERYATVHHLVSTVVGRLEPGRTAADLIAATFPGGSITGAPKLRAMEIIAELEPTARGVYCGAIGVAGPEGTLDLNIAIRTAVVQRGEVTWSAGGGIVADSDPEAEYQETLAKARGIAAGVAGAQGRGGAG